MFNPGRTRRQTILCDCGREHLLELYEETDWSIYSVRCDLDGTYPILSKYEPGRTCPRCKTHKLEVLRSFPSTKDMREQIRGHQITLWRFVKDGEVAKVD